MSILFPEKEEMHNIDVKFTQAYLPEAKKPYYLRTANQKELDIRAAAVKAKALGLTQDVSNLVNQFNTAMEAIFYLVADGFRVKTDYFTVGLRIPGEYDGTETSLDEGASPLVRVQISRPLNNYMKDRVNINFDGTIEKGGNIALAADDSSGISNEVLTIGSIVTISGVGLKIMAEPENQAAAGLYFEPVSGGKRVKSSVVTVNERKTLKALIPLTLTAGTQYRLVIDTWSTAGRSGRAGKNLRTMSSDFTLTAQKSKA